MKNDILVIDTGVLVEFFRDSVLGRQFQKHFLNESLYQYFYLNPLTQTELFYIFCRELGWEKSFSLITDKLKHFLIFEEARLRCKAAELKCSFGIALADCYSIAAGLLLDCPVLMKREDELDRIDISKLHAEILFIDDF